VYQRLSALLAVAALAALPAAAQADEWAQPAVPLNLTERAGLPPDGRANLGGPVVKEVGGALHAAWTEWDGVNSEVRVARLAGNRWTMLGNPCSPVNVSSSRDAGGVDLADDGGLPLVTWTEGGAVQAARYDARTGRWARPWGAVGSAPGGADLEMLEGRPYVGSVRQGAFAGTAEVHRRTADGTAFEQTGGPSGTDPRSFELEGDGTALFAATVGPQGWQSLQRFVDGRWRGVPHPEGTSYGWRIDAMAVDDGVLFVLQSGDVPRSVARFVDGAWETLADVPMSGVTSMAVVGGVLHLTAVEDGAVVVYRLASVAGFERVAGAVNAGSGEELDPGSVSLVDVGGRPWVAWRARSGGRWNARVAGLFAGAIPAPAPAQAAPDCAPRPSVGRLIVLSKYVEPFARGRLARIAIRCKGPGRCRGLVTVRAVNRIRRLVLGRFRVNMIAGQARSVTFRLTPRARRVLRHSSIRYRLRLG
jgi:hypothetical protein